MSNHSTQSKPVIVVDIDGVLFDTPADAVAAANAANGTTYRVDEIFNHNAEHDKSKFVVHGVDQFHKYQLDTANYRQVDGAQQALAQLAKRANIVALTSRNYDLFYESTKQAIQEHFGDLISAVYFTTEPASAHHREKGEIVRELGGRVLVDDAVKYCESAVRQGLPAVLLPQHYNQRGHNWPETYRATDWADAVRIIEQELDRQSAV